ncbi:hypothetical protein [Pseudomonas kitaguniensis]|uniref:hypothetical protein n=1 Tax=Pseudomonas kitaguniensis TaxID=2607908 RepID=UPI000AB54430|nr:hypothetical protein [Pseudomonas kitaguniensis]
MGKFLLAKNNQAVSRQMIRAVAVQGQALGGGHKVSILVKPAFQILHRVRAMA